MKYIISIFFLLYVSTTVAQESWDVIWSEPDTFGLFIRDMDILNEDVARFVGGGNLGSTEFFLSTDDGGTNWDTVFFDASQYKLASLSFPTFYDGYILSTGIAEDNGNEYIAFKIHKSIDAGENWEEIYVSPSDFPFNFSSTMSMEFLNPDTGMFTCVGFAIKTLDGGISWDLIDDTVSGKYGTLKEGVFASFDGSYSCYSSDSLLDFSCKQVLFGGSTTFGDVFKNDSGEHILYSAGLDGNGMSLGYPGFNFGVASISDLDENVSELIHFPYISQIRDIDRTENYIYTVNWAAYGEDYRFIKSEDFGETWYAQSTSGIESIYSSLIRQVECVNDSICYAYSEVTIFKTINGGGPLVEQVEVNHVPVVVSLEEKELEVVIFPNPVESSLRINTNESVSEVQIFSMQGSFIEGKIFTPTNQIELDVSNLSPGIYILQISTENSSSQTRFVKY